MQVTPGTATSMAKHLEALGLIDYTPRRGCRLTAEGNRLALRMIRRHRLIETFLERMLDYDWSEVHLEAEKLEHAVSDTFVDRIDALLSFPPTDPHGDPIPPAGEAVKPSEAICLSDAEEGVPLRLVRVLDNSAAFLNMLKERELIPGVVCRIETRARAAGLLYIAVERAKTTDREIPVYSLSEDAAARIHVSPVDLGIDTDTARQIPRTDHGASGSPVRHDPAKQ